MRAVTRHLSRTAALLFLDDTIRTGLNKANALPHNISAMMLKDGETGSGVRPEGCEGQPNAGRYGDRLVDLHAYNKRSERRVARGPMGLSRRSLARVKILMSSRANCGCEDNRQDDWSMGRNAGALTGFV